MSFTKSVVSSVYWEILTVCTSVIGIPLISLERFIALLKTSVPITNRIPERGQPCLTPLPRLKCFVAKPLFKTQLEIPLYRTVTHFRNCGPKLNTSRDFCKYFNSMESKAFSKSRKTARPGMFFTLVKDIISDIILILSPINLPLTYPVWLELIIVGKTFSSRRAKAFAAISVIII